MLSPKLKYQAFIYLSSTYYLEFHYFSDCYHGLFRYSAHSRNWLFAVISGQFFLS
jgi:hypothetical protein